MHDAIKTALLELAKDNVNKKNIEDILQKTNQLIPEDIAERVAFIKNDIWLESNLEILLMNADQYKANIYQIMQLRERLMWYYWIGIRQPINAKKIVDWYENNQNKIKLYLCSNEEKVSYTSYLTYIGQYYYVANQYDNKALKYLGIAHDTLDKFTGNEELKSYVYATIANIQINLGKLLEGEKNLCKAEEIKPINPKMFLGTGLIECTKALLLSFKGQYSEALNMVSVAISKSINKISQGAILFPEYLTKAYILNNMARYEEAYDVINTNVYQHFKNKNKEEVSTIFLVRTLIELSRAELGIHKISDALKHAEEAVKLLMEDEDRNNLDIYNSKDVYLAPAFVAKGDSLAALGKTEEALYNYKLAKNIYFNIYGIRNVKYMDNVSYLFANGAKVASKLTNKIECNYFNQLLIKYFGNNHPRSVEIKGVCSPSYNVAE